MSEHFDYLVPKDLHLPAPDWRALHRTLLDSGILLPARGTLASPSALRDLSFALGAHEGGRHHIYLPDALSAADVLAAYKADGQLPDHLTWDEAATVNEAVAMLADAGISVSLWAPPHDGATWSTDEHRVGPAFDAGSGIDTSQMAVALFEHDGPHLFVGAGEGTVEPQIDERVIKQMPPFGDCWDFINVVFEGQDAVWSDPETGRAYRIYDLDWSAGLAIGRRVIQICGHDYSIEAIEAFRQEIEQLTGRAMVYAHQHL